MALIKLPLDLGLEVAQIFCSYGLPLRENNFGLLSLEFTEEELSNIRELHITNPRANYLDGIEYLTNLQLLEIKTEGDSAYKSHNASISDKDIKRISSLSSLKSLTIVNQSDITWVCLDKLLNLEELNIIGNVSVDEITGLENLKKVEILSIYGNKNLFKLEQIVTLIKQNNLDILELDLFNYPEILEVLNNLRGLVNCNFLENLSGGMVITYSLDQMSLFHNKCLKIINQISNVSNKKEFIVAVEKYLAENVVYDDEALLTDKRYHVRDGHKVGINGGANSAYNGIMFGSCVCEGYTRAMQYLLKMVGIKTTSVRCISGKDKIKVNHDYHNIVVLPDNGYHSIIKIDDVDMLYCDVCWDACLWQKGNKTLPYTLLTKEEISRDHTLSFEENDINNNHLRASREEIASILNRLSDREEILNEGVTR